MIGDNAKRGLKENNKKNVIFPRAILDINVVPPTDDTFPNVNNGLLFTNFAFYIKKKEQYNKGRE